MRFIELGTKLVNLDAVLAINTTVDRRDGWIESIVGSVEFVGGTERGLTQEQLEGLLDAIKQECVNG